MQPPILYKQVTVHLILALPARFKDELKNQEKNKGETVTLCCKLSKPAADVQWKKGPEFLKAGEKFEMKQKETSYQLQIKDLKIEDSGEYTCVCGDQRTSATVKVNGMESSSAKFMCSCCISQLLLLLRPLCLVWTFVKHCFFTLQVMKPCLYSITTNLHTEAKEPGG